MINSPSEGPHLMIIDDDDRFRERLQKSFKRRGYEVYAFEDGSSAIEAARVNSPEYALVDLRLKGEWGLLVVKSLLEIDSETQIIVLTAYGSIATAIEAVKIGAGMVGDNGQEGMRVGEEVGEQEVGQCVAVACGAERARQQALLANQ